MLTIQNVADFFIIRSHEDQLENQLDEADITPLKLQKLCYYAQGTHLAKHDKKLFNDDIYAWAHGPVVPSLYNKYQSYGAQTIPRPANSLGSQDLILTEEERETLSDVYLYFGQFSASKLRNMTHEETPWLKTPKNNIIDCELIKSYFKENIVA